MYMCVSACQGAALEIFPQALAQAGPPFSGLAGANNTLLSSHDGAQEDDEKDGPKHEKESNAPLV